MQITVVLAVNFAIKSINCFVRMMYAYIMSQAATFENATMPHQNIYVDETKIAIFFTFTYR